MTALFALLLLADAPKLTVKADATPVPDGVAQHELLDKTAYTITDAGGETVAVVWLRTELPASGNADQIANGLTYREVPEGTFLGVVRFPKAFVDFRKQDVPAGTYTLRLAYQPDTGDHAGTAPHTEFALLVPADKDADAEAVEPKEVVKRSRQGLGGDHPAVMLLFPHVGKEDGKLLDKGDGVVALAVRRPVVAGEAKGVMGVALTVAGHSKTR